MSKLTIIANFIAKTDQIDFAKKEMIKAVTLTRAEDGCINYDLHQDNENPAYLFFYENWESREQWLDHMESAHLKAFQEATKDTFEESSIFEMTQIA